MMMFDPEFERWLRRQERMRLIREGAWMFAYGVLAATVTYGLLFLMAWALGGTGR